MSIGPKLFKWRVFLGNKKKLFFENANMMKPLKIEFQKIQLLLEILKLATGKTLRLG